jgi:hypothetical protein
MPTHYLRLGTTDDEIFFSGSKTIWVWESSASHSKRFASIEAINSLRRRFQSSMDVVTSKNLYAGAKAKSQKTTSNPLFWAPNRMAPAFCRYWSRSERLAPIGTSSAYRFTALRAPQGTGSGTTFAED